MQWYNNTAQWFSDMYEPFKPFVDGAYNVYATISTVVDIVNGIGSILGGGGKGA